MTLGGDDIEAAQATRRAELAQVAREEARGRRRRSADMRVAETAVTDATRELERLQALERDGAASRQQVEQATSRIAEARARLEAATVAAAGGRTEVLRRSLAQAERDFAVRREELANQLAQHTAELAAAERIAHELDKAGIEVLYDDRTGKVSPGVKFKDAELIGVPTIVVVGKGLADGTVEVKDRATGAREDVHADHVVDHVVRLVRA